MEAIFELIAALIGAFAQAFFWLFEAVAALLAAVAEFLFLALTQGRPAATQKYQQRKRERESRRNDGTPAVDDSAFAPSQKVSYTHAAIIGSLIPLVLVCGIVTWVVRERVRKQRVADTHAQLKKLADAFANQIQDEDIADPEPGNLPDRDSWRQPIELFVDKALLGSLVVVRSSGPDRKPGSIDDILDTRVIPASAKDVGGELAERGLKALRDRFGKLLPGGNNKQ